MGFSIYFIVTGFLDTAFEIDKAQSWIMKNPSTRTLCGIGIGTLGFTFVYIRRKQKRKSLEEE